MPNANEGDIGREDLAEGRDHLTVTGNFQSDKYPWCPSGFVPLRLKDPGARDLLDEYAKRRGAIDPEFQRDLLEALNNVPAKLNAGYKNFETVQMLQGKARMPSSHNMEGRPNYPKPPPPPPQNVRSQKKQ